MEKKKDERIKCEYHDTCQMVQQLSQKHNKSVICSIDPKDCILLEEARKKMPYVC